MYPRRALLGGDVHGVDPERTAMTSGRWMGATMAMTSRLRAGCCTFKSPPTTRPRRTKDTDNTYVSGWSWPPTRPKARGRRKVTVEVTNVDEERDGGAVGVAAGSLAVPLMATLATRTKAPLTTDRVSGPGSGPSPAAPSRGWTDIDKATQGHVHAEGRPTRVTTCGRRRPTRTTSPSGAKDKTRRRP